jgi:uncharacterized 2Fe-2S/4Fe-4S cluster protein (DUF4445 family)
MAKITFTFNKQTPVSIEVPTGETVLTAARLADVAIDAPCNGNGTCGKCKVHIGGQECLACQTVVNSDITVAVPDTAAAFKTEIRTADISDERELAIFNAIQANLSEFEHKTDWSVIHVTLSEPTLDDPASDWERLSAALADAGVETQSASALALRRMPEVLRSLNWSDIPCLIKQTPFGGRLIDFRGGVYGLAVDIGTTTVAAVLVDLQSGEVLGKASAGNGQIRFGADVIHRIVEASKPGGLDELRRAVVDETIVPLIATLTSDTPALGICRAVFTGNTTMNHLFAGIPPESIRLEPYVPVVNEFPHLTAESLGLPLNPEAEIVIAPNVGSYVGGDITAGTLASMLWKRDSGFALFVDLGTNGELVFGNSEFMFTCACSAGPAIEGGDMSCGMRATNGAIEDCVIDADTLEPTFTVIGGSKPVGLCGSGIIDSVAEMFRAGIVDARGKIVASGSRVKTSEADGVKSYVLAFADASGSGKDVAINEIDLDNFIRAKGAIFSAIRTMLASLDFSIDTIEEVLIAGGLGSGINFANAVRSGMLPDIDLSLYRYVGNSSLAGAYAMLTSDEVVDKVLDVKRNMTYLDLSTHNGYMDEFVAACFLPHTDAALFPSVV